MTCLHDQNLILWNGQQAPYCLVPFALSNFSPRMFDEQNIHCPPAIAHSVPRRQAEYFYGRAAARCALAVVGVVDWVVASGSLRQPLWPPGIVGSISHTQNYAAAIALPASSHRGIGIDVEIISDATSASALSAVAFNAAELRHIPSDNDAVLRTLSLTIGFSAKESFYKAAFNVVGRLFDFDAVELQPFRLSDGYVDLILRTSLSSSLPCGMLVRCHFHMVDTTTVFTSCSLPPGS
jgi:enterobactin synthetase component D